MTQCLSNHGRIVVPVLAMALTAALLFLTCSSENMSRFGLPCFVKQTPTNSSDKTTDVGKSADLILLIWMWPFDHKFELNCDAYGITGCTLTDDQALYPKAHAVMFHHRNIVLNTLPKEPRPAFQMWVWFNMEAPSNSARNTALNNIFNLTCSYRRDSDVFTPYGSLVPVSSNEEIFTQVPAKDKLVCWIVSNWNSRFKRVQYYNELKKHVEIKTYGRAFGEYMEEQL